MRFLKGREVCSGLFVLLRVEFRDLLTPEDLASGCSNSDDGTCLKPNSAKLLHVLLLGWGGDLIRTEGDWRKTREGQGRRRGRGYERGAPDGREMKGTRWAPGMAMSGASAGGGLCLSLGLRQRSVLFKGAGPRGSLS